jgi:acetyltransferase-like isoleucine patch superfamily enzyme
MPRATYSSDNMDFLPNFSKGTLKWIYWQQNMLWDKRKIRHPCKIDFDTNLSMGRGSEIGENTTVIGSLDLGAYSVINPNCYFEGNIKIGKFVGIAQGVVMISKNHPMDRPAMVYLGGRFGWKDEDRADTGQITLGNDSWVGHGARIKKDVIVGEGAVVGMGSVVTHDVPAYAVVAGNPARLIRYRFKEETIKKLLKLKWWDWPEDKIRRNKRFFLSRCET